MVEHPPRCPDDDLGAALQPLELPLDRLAAVYREYVDAPVVLCQAGELLGDLDGELPRGGEDENLGLPAFGVDPLDRRDAERRGLPGTGLGLAGHVAPFEYRGYRAHLDGRGLLKTQILYRPEHLLRYIELLECDIVLHSSLLGVATSLSLRDTGGPRAVISIRSAKRLPVWLHDTPRP